MAGDVLLGILSGLENIGRASEAERARQLELQDAELQRQYRQAQINKLTAKPADPLDTLLTPSEASQYGVPYGTTRRQFVGTVPTKVPTESELREQEKYNQQVEEQEIADEVAKIQETTAGAPLSLIPMTQPDIAQPQTERIPMQEVAARATESVGKPSDIRPFVMEKVEEIRQFAPNPPDQQILASPVIDRKAVLSKAVEAPSVAQQRVAKTWIDGVSAARQSVNKSTDPEARMMAAENAERAIQQFIARNQTNPSFTRAQLEGVFDDLELVQSKRAKAEADMEAEENEERFQKQRDFENLVTNMRELRGEGLLNLSDEQIEELARDKTFGSPQKTPEQKGQERVSQIESEVEQARAVKGEARDAVMRRVGAETTGERLSRFGQESASRRKPEDIESEISEASVDDLKKSSDQAISETDKFLAVNNISADDLRKLMSGEALVEDFPQITYKELEDLREIQYEAALAQRELIQKYGIYPEGTTQASGGMEERAARRAMRLGN